MMRMRILMALALATGLLFGAGANAQQPSSPDYGAPITLDQAKEAAAAALAEAKKNNWRIAVAVVDPGGLLIYFEKLDGGQNASSPLAVAKARTAALYRRSTKVFADQFSAGNTGFMSFPDEARPVASEGGIPIMVNGKLIGAIGVSGGTGQQDGIASTAGANAVK
jgi:uncharacterized protein GlcG (DUF336 family)